MSGSGGFQQFAFNQPAMAIAGDFASQNPYFTYDAGPGGLVAGSGGCDVGVFAWTYPPDDPDGTPTAAQNYGFGPVAGFVQRAMQASIITYLADASMTILQGQPMTLMTGGDFWVVNTGSAEADIGYKAFANLTTGKVSFGAAGSNPGGANDTSGGAVVATTLTVTGSISNDILTVTNVSAGVVYPGALLSSNGAGYVQPYGTAGTTGTGGNGTYALDIDEQNVAAGTTIGGSYGVYTVGTNASTPFAVGMYLSGGTTLSTSPPPVLTYLITGAGLTGSTFAVNSGTTSQTSHAIQGNVAYETKWYARSTGLNGELVKISDHPVG
jgi:hypothetical protein